MWNAELYESFSNERLRPSLDLTARLEGDPFSILDVGCGTGMSTWCLRQRFPYAKIKGVDKSDAMLAKARELNINVDFFQKDCSNNLTTMGKFDLVFSNAFLQWLDDQEAFIRDIRSTLNPNGMIAMQIPLFSHIPLSRLLQDIIDMHYKEQCADIVLFHDYSVQEYFDMISRYFADVEIWKTAYVHQMDNSDKIVDFVRGTALLPYQENLTEEEFAHLIELLKKETAKIYPASENGKVLFPFERLFVIAKDSKL